MGALTAAPGAVLVLMLFIDMVKIEGLYGRGPLSFSLPNGEVLLYRTGVAMESNTRQSARPEFLFNVQLALKSPWGKVGQVEPGTRCLLGNSTTLCPHPVAH